MTTVGSHRYLIVQGFGGCRLRHSVRHIKKRCYPSHCRCARLALYVCLGSEAWLSKMYVLINDSWQYKTTRSIDYFIAYVAGYMLPLYNISDTVIIYNDGRLKGFALIDNATANNNSSHSREK